MNMPQRRLGKNGPFVGAIGLGAMSFSGIFGTADDDISMQTMQACLDAGINFWDTANIYGMGRSENIIGRFLQETGAQVTLATKVGIIPGPPRDFSNEDDYIRAELEGSFKRLNRTSVELYYIHRRQQSRPIEAVAETMSDLIDEGLIGGWGLSEVAPATIRRAHAVTPVTAVQNEYSLWSRAPELGVVQTCRELDITFVPFSPIARGALTDVDLDPLRFDPHDFRRVNPRFMKPNWTANMRYIAKFRAISGALNVPTAALALAWVLHRDTGCLPIPGTRTTAHLAQWLPAFDIKMTPDLKAKIDAVLPVGWAHGDRYSIPQYAGVETYS